MNESKSTETGQQAGFVVLVLFPLIKKTGIISRPYFLCTCKILRWILRKWDVGAWTGSSWLRIGTGGGSL
jgi:hypothetical protein